MTLKKFFIVSMLLCALIVLTAIVYFIEPPFHSGFKKNSVISVQAGDTIAYSAMTLQNDRLIRSSFALRIFVKLFYSNNILVAGEYLFDHSQSMPLIAWRLTHAGFNIPQAMIVIPEGSTVKDIARIIKAKYPNFEEKIFIQKATSSEGYLFPNTYHFLEGITPDEVIEIMSNTFKEQLRPYAADIASSGHTEKEIIIMASLLEGEAQTEDDKKIVAGILWKRIDQGIRLQVDSTLKYSIGKASAELTTADLQKDSPYNTYTNYGLPPGPISNPGIESIEAALHPTLTEFLYFLTDNEGGMHYAVTFDEHVKNKLKYLR